MNTTPGHNENRAVLTGETIVRQALLFLNLRILGVAFVFLLIHMGFHILTIAPTSPRWFVNNSPLFLMGIRGIELFTLGYVILGWFFNFYKITGENIIYNTGVFRVRRDVYALRNIETVSLDQSFFGRLFKYGEIYLYAPTLNDTIVMKHIYKPWQYLKIINSLLPTIASGGGNGEKDGGKQRNSRRPSRIIYMSKNKGK